jgi:hypothetical protein
MPRPYLNHTIDELEQIVKENKHARPALAEVKEELGHRTTARAKRLLRDVDGLLTGEVAMPKRPPRPDSPKDQLKLDGVD